jgi:hypothetical protein
MKERTIKIIIAVLIGGYLGGAVGIFANIHWYQWQFYPIVVPVALLLGIYAVI